MEKTYDQDETDRKTAVAEPKSKGGTAVAETERAERERKMQNAEPTKISDADILANTPPVPLPDKLAAIARDEAAHGGLTARERQDRPQLDRADDQKTPVVERSHR